MSRLNQRSQRVLFLFVLLTGLPLAALGWLGWRFLQQDRDLELQRQRDQLRNVAELLARDLQTELDLAERALGADAPGLPASSDDRAFFRLQAGKVVDRAGIRLPFYPAASAPVDTAATFASAERLEFAGQCDQALIVYRRLAASSDAVIRAGALLRHARCLRQLQRHREALDVYDQLGALDAATMTGMPAGLIARREKMMLYSAAGNAAAARTERERLGELLTQGRYVLDQGTYEFFAEALQPGASPPPKIALARAAARWSLRWQSEGCGRAADEPPDPSVIGLWCRAGRDDVRVAIIAADQLLEKLRATAQSLQVVLSVVDAAGREVLGAGGEQVTFATRQLSDLSLPWQLRVSSGDPSTTASLMSMRRMLVAGGLALMLLIVSAAGVFVFRAVNRELETARLQADFINAVSHEFRTPLTAMNHLTEMLQEAAVPAERIPQYYAALHRETTRLHRVVEGLLDFRRFESGRGYRMAPLDALEVVQQVVDSFAAREGAGRLQAPVGTTSATIRADREAVSIAVGNLLDNALKYSPHDSPVTIGVEVKDDMVGISVADRGPGIAQAERRRVFRQFERGDAAARANVKGTGIGLAIVQAVVEAHGGHVDLQTAAGEGSRFTLFLPRA